MDAIEWRNFNEEKKWNVINLGLFKILDFSPTAEPVKKSSKSLIGVTGSVNIISWLLAMLSDGKIEWQSFDFNRKMEIDFALYSLKDLFHGFHANP